MFPIKSILVLILGICLSLCYDLKELNFFEEHLPFFNQSPFNEKFAADTETHKARCWGHEAECPPDKRFSNPECPGDFKGYTNSKNAQHDTFYFQTDFGYVKEQRNELSLLCHPKFKDDSSLECTKHLRFCRGRNIMMNFTALLNRKDLIRYNMDVLAQGDIGGHCRFNKDELMKESDHMSPLQSWAPELKNFRELPESSGTYCDVTIHKPTYIMKIDATVNMYHHFCDFFNLYVSQHVNFSHPEGFSTDVQIIIWETYRYWSNFGVVWDVFTEYPVWNLNQVRGKIVCFKNVVFPLLPRMIFGLFYNTPIIAGCEKSGLFRAFSEHVHHRLRVPLLEREDDRVRVTFLSRNTSYRNILNEDSLIRALQKRPEFFIRKEVFDSKKSFKDQLAVVRNTDLFVGIHGAGLTHLLFLPDWAVIFELYNCEDPHCYLDLSRLRGVKYITWEDSSKLYQQDELHSFTKTDGLIVADKKENKTEESECRILTTLFKPRFKTERLTLARKSNVLAPTERYFVKKAFLNFIDSSSSSKSF